MALEGLVGITGSPRAGSSGFCSPIGSGGSRCSRVSDSGVFIIRVVGSVLIRLEGFYDSQRDDLDVFASY
jgi:hypothetical protein